VRKSRFATLAAILLSSLLTLSFVALQGAPTSLNGSRKGTETAALSLDPLELDLPGYMKSQTALRFGDNLASRLISEGFSREEVNSLTFAAAEVLNLAKLKAGTTLELERDELGLARLRLSEPGRLESVLLTRTAPLLFIAEVEKPRLDTVVVRYEGSIQTSFYQSCLDAGGSDALAAIYYSVFRDVFYFNSEARTGDRFRMIVEEVRQDGNKVGYGRVLAADYQGARGNFSAVWGPLDHARSEGDYFDAEGYSFRRTLMQIPFEDRVAVRVTSDYGNRYHPISGKWRKHNGMDLAAPIGTPVLAAGDGVVSKVGRNHPGYGNWVEIRHPNGYQTRYGHLHRFASGMRVGRRVKQGERIGYVGMTGYATGPHLHYEVLLEGKRLNPKSIKTSPVKKLDEDQLAVFLMNWYEPWMTTLDHPGWIPGDRYHGPQLPSLAEHEQKQEDLSS